MNIFATQFLNSVLNFNAGGLMGGLGNTGSPTTTSPFAALLGDDAGDGSDVKTAISLLQKAPGTGKITTEDGLLEDPLSPPDTLLSELLASSWQTLQSGETLKLQSGWTLFANQDGTLSLAAADGQIAFPSFTKDQLQKLLDAYQNQDNLLSFDPFENQDGEEATQERRLNVQEKFETDVQAETSLRVRTPAAMPTNTVETTDASGDINNPLRPLWDTMRQLQQRESYLFGTPGTMDSLNRTNTSGTVNVAGMSNPMMNQINKPNTPGTVGSPPQGETGMSVLSASSHTGFDAIVDINTMISGDGGEAAPLPAALQQQGIRLSTDGSLYGTQPVPMAQLHLIVQKMAEKGDTRTLTVRLDPPELGRVQVNLTSGSDKIVKAHILVEKPEALALLKKDSAALEKALQNAGIDMDADGISMELATDDGSGQGGFAQQAFMELWAENNNERLAQTGTEIANENNVTAQALEEDEFYQSDLAVNIKV